MPPLSLTAALCSLFIIYHSTTVSATEHNHSQELGTHTNTPRFTLYFGDTEFSPATQPNKVLFQTGGYQAPSTTELARVAIDTLNHSYEELVQLFDVTPSNDLVLKFLTPNDFQRETGAPAWTSAMYYNGEITVPINPRRSIDIRELSRALRHEYVHAVTAELSNQRIPAWIDEGLAQIIEGPPNPVLGPALRRWSTENLALPLSWLEDGFMSLDDELVPVAYAQSLLGARSIVNRYGYSAVKSYLTYLANGDEEPVAFELAFGVDKEEFQRHLNVQLKQWAASDAPQP